MISSSSQAHQHRGFRGMKRVGVNPDNPRLLDYACDCGATASAHRCKGVNLNGASCQRPVAAAFEVCRWHEAQR